MTPPTPRSQPDAADPDVHPGTDHGREHLPPTSDPEEIERRLAAMPVLEAIETQRSIRRVLPDPVDDVVVTRLVELALEAPTGGNGQNWEFIVVRDARIRSVLGAQYRRVWRLYGSIGRRLAARQHDSAPMTRILDSVQWQVDHFDEIPVLVVCCLKAGYGRIPFVPNPPIFSSSHYGSVYPSAQNMLLAARAVGLGASLITLPLWSLTVARRALGLPLGVEPCCLIALGWPRGRYGPKARKSVKSVLHYETYTSTSSAAAPSRAD